MGKEKFVRFEAYRVSSINTKDESKMKYDITPLLKKIYTANYNQKKVRIYGDKVLLRSFGLNTLTQGSSAKYGKMKLSFFNMVRMRDEKLAVIKDSPNQNLKNLNLGKNEYIAEDITGLFDNQDYILFIQRNIHSLSIEGIRSYLNIMYQKLYNNNDKLIVLEPVFYKNKIQELMKKQKLTKFQIQVASNKVVKNSLLDGITLGLRNIDPNFIEITVSAGRKKEDELNKNEIKKILKDVQSNPASYNKCKVSAKNDGERAEIFDLLKGKIEAIEKFSTMLEGKEVHLNPDVVRDRMQEIYLGEGYHKDEKSIKEKIRENLN